MDSAKRAASARAVEYVETDCNIGIGSGSTIVFLVEELAKVVRQKGLKVKCIPTSFQAKQLIIEHDLPLSSLDETPQLDVAFDGADEVDNQVNCIKGGGGCLLQEKIVAACSKKLIIVVDETKISSKFGENWKGGIPIEVIPLAYKPIINQIETRHGGTAKLRMGVSKAGPVVTDNGNFIIDWKFDESDRPNWEAIDQKLTMMPGVVGTGLFIRMATAVIIGHVDGKTTFWSQN